MSTIQEYLKSTKTAFISDLDSFKDLHIVIGNESCDLDSTVSSLVLAFFLDKYKTKIPQISNSALVIPILNISFEHFFLRTENCFVLQESGTSLEYLIFRNNVDFEELLKTKRVTTSLVDHHILSKNDYVLQPTVIQIFDHRPFDIQSNWMDDVKLKIQEVGSCSTLVADEILTKDESVLTRDVAYMIYETIIYDTVALLPKNGRVKEMDLIIIKKLEDKFKFPANKCEIFHKLQTAHNDISHLTPQQILMKDLKIVDDIPVPGLPMLVENFLKIDNAYNAIDNMASEYRVLVVVVIGLDASDSNLVKRDVAIFWKNGGEILKDTIVEKFYNSQQLKSYNFGFKEVSSRFSNITCLRQTNVKLSRKQIIPLIKDAVIENIK